MHVFVVLAVFIAASVEFVEAFTIVLAASSVRGWRSALYGTLAALVALAALVIAFGYAILALFPLGAFRALIGVILLLFGLKWMRKAILRATGRKALHDEAAIYQREVQSLRSAGQNVDALAFATAFNGVLLEGIEVIFIVLTLGGNAGMLDSAILGAGLAFVVVLAAGLLLRAPLSRVPENTLKWIVGVMLTAFGTFWAGEGIGIHWWQQDVSIIVLIVLYALLGFLLQRWMQPQSAQGPA
ncbi:MAG: hypothetical protein M0Z66_12820 [Thermaerobacter sp.]|nr:hypothetical protein [Thermaerobacter sp.]